MDRQENSLIGTPADNVVVQRRSKSKSYRLSYRSCLSAASRLGFTPTMTSRRINSSRRAPKSTQITERVNPEQLALLVKKDWQLSYVTPLYRFRYTQLKSYSRQLSAFIAAQKLQGMAVEVDGPQDHYSVSLSIVPGMVEAGDNAETVLIQILSKAVFTERNEPQKRVWSGWLTCINGNPKYLRSLPEDFTCLPLFGSNGPDGLTVMVKSWFQSTFDCCFGPLEISQTSLHWLLALWTNCHADSSIQHLTMVWSIPVAPPLQVTYVVEPQDAWALWMSVKKTRDGGGRMQQEREEEEEDSIGIEEVMHFIQSLKSHFYRHFRLDLSAGSLSQVSTSLGSAKSSGRIKISNSRYIITTLMLLTECALLKLPI